MNRQESIKHLKDEWFSFTNTMKESLETLIPELKGYDENSVKDWLINKLTNFKYYGLLYIFFSTCFFSVDKLDIMETAGYNVF